MCGDTGVTLETDTSCLYLSVEKDLKQETLVIPVHETRSLVPSKRNEGPLEK